MLIYDALKKDHEKLKEILQALHDTTERALKKRQDLLRRLKQELVAHLRAEEDVFYTGLKEHDETEDLAFERYEEHHVADILLNEIEGLDASDKRWTAKVSVLKETLEHHIKEEEREMFKEAKKVFDRETAMHLADAFENRKKEIIAEQFGGRRPGAPSPHAQPMI